MKIVVQDEKKYILALSEGEDFLKTLEDFLRKNNITAAVFTAIGGASALKLGFYKPITKTYDIKEFSGEFEILNITGNVSVTDKSELVVHSHGTFSGEDMKAFGAHIFGINVKPVMEISLDVVKGEMVRTHNENIGLNTF